MISIENSSGRVIVAVARMMVRHLLGRAEARPPGQLGRAVLDDDDGRVGHFTDGDRQPGEREQIDGLAEQRRAAAR